MVFFQRETKESRFSGRDKERAGRACHATCHLLASEASHLLSHKVAVAVGVASNKVCDSSVRYAHS